MSNDFFDEIDRDDGGPGKSRPDKFVLNRMINVEFSDAPHCLVEDLIPTGGLIVVWGPPKCGKTFWVFDLVAHIALGIPYGRNQREVEQGSVCYIAAEGEAGIKTRTVAFRQKRLVHGEDPPFHLMVTSLDLVHQIDELIAAIGGQLHDGCKVIVVDTLNRTISGSETKDEDMGRYVSAADQLRQAFNCAVIIIHHCGVAGDRPRGHSSLSGAVDAQISIQKDADGTVLATLEMMKDGPEGVMLRCRLESVEAGTDTRGKPITSCVVEHLDAVTTGEKKKARRLSSAQKRAMDMLQDAIAAGGEIPPASNHIPANTRCVTEDCWRDYCYQGGISSGGQDAKRIAFTRAADGLIGNRIVGSWASWVWPIRGDADA